MVKKKKNRKERTTKGRIRSALRQLWLRSNERAAALKRDEYKCVECGLKQSKAKGKEVKVHVDHIRGQIDWEAIFKPIYKYLLPDPEELQVLCEYHHKIKTERERRERGEDE